MSSSTRAGAEIPRTASDTSEEIGTMATIEIKNQNGGETGQLTLDPSVFEAKQNSVLVREVYNATMANARSVRPGRRNQPNFAYSRMVTTSITEVGKSQSTLPRCGT